MTCDEYYAFTSQTRPIHLLKRKSYKIESHSNWYVMTIIRLDTWSRQPCHGANMMLDIVLGDVLQLLQGSDQLLAVCWTRVHLDIHVIPTNPCDVNFDLPFVTHYWDMLSGWQIRPQGWSMAEHQHCFAPGRLEWPEQCGDLHYPVAGSEFLGSHCGPMVLWCWFTDHLDTTSFLRSGYS